MMREIKFRGKRLDNGEWVEGTVEFHLIDGDLSSKDKKAFITYDEMDLIGKVYRFTFEVDPETVGQYIGLKDLEKTKVFEHDILCDDESGRRFVVTSLDFECGFTLKEVGSDTYESMIDWCAVDDGDFLVLYKIGSVHDNPELLVKK